jgi:hypothetical protein
MVDDVKTVCEENRKLIAEARKVVIETYELIASFDLLSDFRRLIKATFGNMLRLDSLSLASLNVFTSISDVGVEEVIREVLEYAST